jgi:hypothetical protein
MYFSESSMPPKTPKSKNFEPKFEFTAGYRRSRVTVTRDLRAGTANKRAYAPLLGSVTVIMQ